MQHYMSLVFTVNENSFTFVSGRKQSDPTTVNVMETAIGIAHNR